jgi:hypothetical protein
MALVASSELISIFIQGLTQRNEALASRNTSQYTGS